MNKIMKIKRLLKVIIAWYGYIVKSTISALSSFIWLNLGVFALTNLVGGLSIITISWNGFMFTGLLCYELFQRKWILQEINMERIQNE